MNFFLKKIFLFILLFSIVNFVISIALNSVNYFDFSVNQIYSLKYSYFKQNESKFNVLFFGSSRTYRQIDPKIIDSRLKSYKIKSFNFGSPATFNPEALILYKEFLKKQVDSKKIYVFLELTQLTPISNVNTLSPRSYYYLNFDVFKFVFKYSRFERNTFLYSYFKGFFLNYILPFKQSYRESEKRFLGRNKDGYYPLDLDIKDNFSKSIDLKNRNLGFLKDTLSLKKYKKNTIFKSELNKVYIDYLDELVKISDKKNIKLFFIIPPRVFIPSYFKTNKLKDRIIDIASFQNNPKLFLVKNNFDNGHLNSFGAEIYSNMLAEGIKEKIK